MNPPLAELSAEEKRTFRLHLAHSLLESLASGIITNAALMAVKTLHAADWQLTLPLGISSIGMFAAWFAGQRMARRDKRPFILLPFALQTLCVLAMALVPGPLWFLVLAGASAIFETTVRPAMTAFFRQNYRPDFRGRASGIIRGWCAIAFLLSNLSSAAVMQYGSGGRGAIMVQMVLAAMLLAACLACISRVRIREEAGKSELPGTEVGRASGVAILKQDRRFRRYLAGMFLFAFGGLLYVSLIPAVFAKDFHYSYVTCALLVHVIPSIVSFAATRSLGQRVDHAHPLKLWAVLRVGWGLDPFLVALAALFPPAGAVAMGIAVVARCFRGAAMGTTWVMWWLVGINYFAPPGANTSRYMGIQVFLNGAARLAAAGISAWMLGGISRMHVLLIGGSVVMLSALHVWWQSSRDPDGAGSLVKQDRRFQEL